MQSSKPEEAFFQNKAFVADLKADKPVEYGWGGRLSKNGTMLLKISKTPRFDDNIRESVFFGYTIFATFEETVSKDRILNCRLHSRYESQLKKEKSLQRLQCTGLNDRQKDLLPMYSSTLMT